MGKAGGEHVARDLRARGQPVHNLRSGLGSDSTSTVGRLAPTPRDIVTLVCMAPQKDPHVSQPGGLRRLGPLERAAMSVFWAQPDRHLTVRQVSAQLNAELAYTTVMTLLSRLHTKRHLERRRQGRAWAYRPVLSHNEHIARAMTAALHESDDHADALLHFIEHLTTEEQQALRRRLGGGHER